MSGEEAPLAAVTGASGFIGGHVAAALAARGWRLRLLLRRDPRLPATGQPVEVVPGSLDEPGALAALAEGADAVIHLAGAVRARGPDGFMAVNRDGTEAMAAAWARHAPGARFVLLSSLAAREPGLSPYAASKAAGEAALAAAAGAGGCSGSVAVLRPGAVYGPGDAAGLALFRTALWPVQPVPDGPEARIGLIHARDLAEAVAAMAPGRAPTGVFELADAEGGHRWAGIVATVCAATGRRARPLRVPGAALTLAGLCGDLAARAGLPALITPGKVREIRHPDWAVRPDRMPPAGLWRPRTGLAEGFAETLAWYRAQGWMPPARPGA